MLATLTILLLAQTPRPPLDGKEVFEKRCTGCHALDTQRVGPKLRGVYGRKAGAVEGFPYSNELKASHLTWNADTLDKWLSDPETLIPGTDMAFRMERAEERAAVIEFLKKLNEPR